VEIEVAKLREAANAIFQHLEKRGVERLEIDGECYWHIDARDRYAMDKLPGHPDVGSTYDDYADLLRVASGEQDVLAWHLMPLASVLNVLGSILPEKLAGVGGDKKLSWVISLLML
jgi:hypothetical protein